jgi:tRNA dimethylallyltransferase
VSEQRRPKAALIAGPTASGKSGAALALATRFGGTIINADSMQVYRELRVLTARPSAADERAVPHRLYGIVSAAEACSVGRWLDEAAHAIAEAQGEGRLPILVGGTGLYFKVLTEGLAPIPDIPNEVRAFWRGETARLGSEKLHRALAEKDPAMAARLGPSDPQRVVRALEVIDATGVSLAEWQGAGAAPRLDPKDAFKVLIAPERETVYATIDARFDRMLEQGALDEASELARLGLDEGFPAMRALGVRELIAYLVGRCSLAAAAAQTKTVIRRYAKRQMTWARRFMADWEWVPDAGAAVVAAERTLRGVRHGRA